MAYLEVESDNQRGKVPIKGGKVTIGRHPKNTLTLSDERASRYHCEIERTAKGFVLRDLGSRNGTMIGAERIDQHPLTDGDTFHIGTTALRFVVSAENGDEATAQKSKTTQKSKPAAPSTSKPAAKAAAPGAGGDAIAGLSMPPSAGPEQTFGKRPAASAAAGDNDEALHLESDDDDQATTDDEQSRSKNFPT